MPGFAVVGRFALLAPTGTPYEALARVNKDLNDILAHTEVSQLLRRNGDFNGGGTLDEVHAFFVPNGPYGRRPSKRREYNPSNGPGDLFRIAVSVQPQPPFRTNELDPKVEIA